MSDFEPRTSKRGNTFEFSPSLQWLRVAGDGYSLEFSAKGVDNPSSLADRLIRRHEAINADFAQVRDLVTASTHKANVPTYLRKLEAVRALWHLKGTKWRDAYKRADYATRRMYLSEEAKAAASLISPTPTAACPWGRCNPASS